MTFSDSDLKRLKDLIPISKRYHMEDMEITVYEFEALIARLEAAENLAHEKHFHEPRGWCDCAECKTYKAWRKAAGK